MVESIFSAIGDAITSFAGVLGNGFQSLLGIFWDSTASSGAGALTLVGTLSLIGVGIGIVYWAFTLIRRLIHLRG